MPELPEVETVRRTLLPHVVGQRIVTVAVPEARLRLPVDISALRQRLPGRSILGVRRRAKYLLFDMQGGDVLMVHLGMSGRLGIVAATHPRKKHDHVIWGLEDGRELRFNDPRRFGLVDIFSGALEAVHPRLKDLGVEPLDTALFTGAFLHQISREVAKPIKNFVMDGQRIVGVGNIYACESLFASGIHPTRAAGRLSRPRCDLLVGAIRNTLQAAIDAGGTTLRDFANVQGEAGYFAVQLQVYGREEEPCSRCNSPIRRVVQAGRSTFFALAASGSLPQNGSWDDSAPHENRNAYRWW